MTFAMTVAVFIAGVVEAWGETALAFVVGFRQ
jgi:hypothetical protein